MLVACLQLKIDLCNWSDNTRRALDLAKQALNKGAHILVFPELFLTGFCYQSSAWSSSPFPTLDPFRTVSKKYGCLIIGSLMSERMNLGFCLDSENIEFRPKIHPFDQEKEYFRGGDFITPIDTKYGKIGLQICYDLRFPEVARSLALNGADILVTIAQFPFQRLFHWRTLCIARAIENQIPHIACNWANSGGSIIIDAWGEVQAEAGYNETLILSQVNFAESNDFRKAIPCFADRRPEIYK